ncbi:CoA pyrophosphatase [Sphingomonas sp. HT-1]|uniref:CoA pyrophosphatase n=1 Tax=unclassified Sphingomonas TaxID=196159 RepID=UPI00030893CF|nr:MULTISPECIES: CoA pyrophosphatase [unclassified Sphingomonas]KTF68965.1 coenzyme A pyrophosphatase [Sphingomonas sp. WG]
MKLAARLRTALAQAPQPAVPLLPGDLAFVDPAQAPSAAAVLVAVTDSAEPGVILTQRNAQLRRHAGQIAFPGGRIDAGDRDAIEAALREAEEEIALPRRHVEVVGTADRYRTVTGFDVTPVIGVVPADLVLVASEAEVADVFEVPLGFLLDAANHAEKHAVYQGQQRHYYEIQWQQRRIWGATAAMIINLSRRMQWPI